MLNVAFSELKMKKGKVVLTNRGSIVSISIAKASLLKSSMTLKVLNLLPLVSESDIKSIDQQVCGI